MKRYLAALVLFVSSWAYAGDILVKFSPEASREDILELCDGAGAEIQELIERIQVYRMSASDPGLAVSYLRGKEKVLYAEPDHIAHLAAVTPSDTFFSQQWGLEAIQAPSAWDTEKGLFRSVTVCVLDTGVDLVHNDLKNRLWTNSGESAVDNDLDDDGNGYVDDRYGWNFVDNDDDDVQDDNGHGTHCAGILGAEPDNGQGVAGVNWNVSIMAVKVMDKAGVGSYSDIAKGIIYAADMGAEVISMSIGGEDSSSSLEDAVLYAFGKGVVMVAAAGNGLDSDGDGANDKYDQVIYPAFYSKVIAVGASATGDTRAVFSSYGPQLAVMAPGVTIMSCILGGTYGSLDGTSMATPFVAGIASLIKVLRPDATPLAVEQIIISSCDDMASAGWDETTGFGRVNLYRALALARQDGNAYEPQDVFNYPNPFNPALGESTNIAIPGDMLSDDIEIRIYSLKGDLVRMLDSFEDPSVASWDGRNEAGDTVATGLYFYHVKTPLREAVGKMTVLKR